MSRREPLAPFLAEERFCRRAAGKPPQGYAALPAPLRTSLAFRHYLAVRDVFVRRAARGLASAAEAKLFAKALVAGRRAARAMWRFTRDRRKGGANELILANDAKRFRAWQQGKPVFGSGWQLCYKVKDFAPALHLVAVEQRQSDGTWLSQQECLTIEFQTRAAQPRGHIVREHAAPVPWDDRDPKPRLRIVVRGIGQVMISDIALTDGSTVLRARGWGSGRWRRLGEAAPHAGLPPLVWDVNRGTLELHF